MNHLRSLFGTPAKASPSRLPANGSPSTNMPAVSTRRSSDTARSPKQLAPQDEQQDKVDDQVAPSASASTRATHSSQRRPQALPSPSTSSSGSEAARQALLQPRRATRTSLAAGRDKTASIRPRLSSNGASTSASNDGGSPRQKHVGSLIGRSKKSRGSLAQSGAQAKVDEGVSARTRGSRAGRAVTSAAGSDVDSRPALKRSRRSDVSSEDEEEQPALKRRIGRAEQGKGRAVFKKSAQKPGTKPASQRKKLANKQDSDDSGSDWEPAPVDELENPRLADRMQSIELTKNEHGIEYRAGLRVGDVVATGGGTEDEPWLASLKTIAGRKVDFQHDTGPNGKRLRRLDSPWFELSWLYSRAAFLSLDVMKTDWQWAPKVLQPLGDREYVETDHSDWVAREELSLWFWDDLEQDLKPIERASSTETVFRFDDTYPSPFDASDRDSSAGFSHPLTRFRAHLNKEPITVMPSYFWGDHVRAGDDAERHCFYVRTSFNFQPSEAVKRSRTSNGKGRSSRKPDGKPVTFNKHGLSRTPYNPRNVQVYYGKTGRWYNVQELRKGGHFTAPSNARSFVDLEDSSDSDSDMTDYDCPPSAKGKGKALPKKKKKKVKVKAEIDTRSAVTRLAKSEMIRGGAYGLIGNSYLVTRANELIKIIEDGEEELEAVEKEMEELLADEREWKEGVERRKELGLEAGEAPEGCRWQCPS